MAGGRNGSCGACRTFLHCGVAEFGGGEGLGAGDARTKREQAPAPQKGCVKRVKYFDGCGFASRVY